jgi:PIN domain nuclease of toxin-antitoxin system
VILLDAYAVLALARDERAADEAEAIIRTNDVGISAVNLLEVLDRLVRRYGWSPNETSARLGLMIGERLMVVPTDTDIAWRGALLRARHYERNACALSLADCVLLASARRDDAVVTSDPAVAAVARAEGIDVIALPDSSGRRP